MKVEIINQISKTDKSSVYMVYIPETSETAIMKELSLGDENIYKHLINLQSAYFPKIINVEKKDDKLVIIEELITGQTLRECLDEISLGKRDVFYEIECTTILTDVCRALKQLHQAESPIILRDLKPENIILMENRHIKIIDFDAARIHKNGIKSDTITLGTKEYASPEQYGFSQTNSQSDIYSFGIIMEEMLSSCNLSAEYMRMARKIVKKSTMLAPDDRYCDGEQLESALSKLDDISSHKTARKRNIFVGIAIFIVGIIVGIIINAWVFPRVKRIINRADSYEKVINVPIDADSVNCYQMYLVDESGVCSFLGYPDEISPQVVHLKAMYDQYYVNEINEYAFCERNELRIVVIPDGYSSIGRYAFWSCDNLEAVVIPSTVVVIDDTAFGSVPNLTIYCEKDSCAEIYAKKNEISYKIID